MSYDKINVIPGEDKIGADFINHIQTQYDKAVNYFYNIKAGECINYIRKGIINISFIELQYDDYIPIFKKQMLFNGIIRVKFNLWDTVDTSVSYAKILKNGINSGQLFSTNNSILSCSEDIEINMNDILEIYCLSDNGECNIQDISLCSNMMSPVFI